MDNTYRANIQVTDSGSDSIDAHRASVRAMLGTYEDAERIFSEFSEVASALQSELSQTDPVVARITDQLRDLVAEGYSVQSAVDTVTESFSGLYAEGYSAADANQALTFALSELSVEAGSAASALQEEVAAAQEAAGATQELAQSASDAEEAAGTLTGGVDGLVQQLGNIGPVAAIGIGAIKAIIDLQDEAVMAFAEDEASQSRMGGIVEANIENYRQYASSIEDVIAASMDLRFTDDATRNSLGLLFAATKNYDESIRRLTVSQNLARFGEKDLETATQALNIALETGTTRGLRQFGIFIDKGASSAEIFAQVQDQTAGASERFLRTTLSTFEGVSNARDEFVEGTGSGMASFVANLNLGKEAMYEQGGATGFLAKGYEDLKIGIDVLGPGLSGLIAGFGQQTEAAEETARAQEGASADIFATWSNLYDDLTAITDDITNELLKAGHDAGEGYSVSLLESLQARYGDLEQAIAHMLGIMDIKHEAAEAGAAAGAAFANEITSKLRQGKENVTTIVNAIIAAINAAVRAAGSLSGAAAAAGAGGSVATSFQEAASYTDVGKTPSGIPVTSTPTVSGGSRAGSRAGSAAARAADAAAAKAAREYEQLLRAQEQALRGIQAVADELALDDVAERVATAQAHAAHETAVWDAALDDISAQAQVAKDALSDMAEASEEKVHALSVELRGQNQILKQLQREADDAYDTLIEKGDKARAVMDEISRAAARQREAFQDASDALSDEMRAFDAAAKLAMAGPLAELAGMDAGIEAQTRSIELQREAIGRLQAQLSELDAEEHRDDRAERMEDQAQSVANLSAKLRGLIPGSQEYLQTQKELAAAQRDLEQSQKRAGLEDQIVAQEKAVALQEESLRQMERDRADRAKQVEAMQAASDLERANIEARMEALAREQELYERQQRDKEAAAAEEARLADLALVAEQEKQAARQASTLANIEGLQTEIEAEQHNASERARIKNAEIKGIEEKATAIGLARDVAVQAAKDTVLAAQDEAKALRDNIEVRKDQEAHAKAIADYMDAYSVDAVTAEAAIAKAMPHVAGMATAASVAGKALSTDFTPAVLALRDQAGPALSAFYNDTWVDYFGTPGANRMGKVTNLLATHNPQGLWTYWEGQVALGFGGEGLGGVSETAINLWFTGMSGDIDAAKLLMYDAAFNAGVYVVDTMIAGAESRAQAFANALADIVTGGGGSGSMSVGVPVGGGRSRGAVSVGGHSTHTVNVNVRVDGNGSGAGLPTAKGSYKAVARTIVLDIADELRLQGLVQ